VSPIEGAAQRSGADRPLTPLLACAHAPLSTVAPEEVKVWATRGARAALAEARARSSDPAVTEAAAALEARLR
jgi:hypothetical protein